MAGTAHIAIDLGAESGRVVVGVLDRDQHDELALSTHEVHRFEHHPMALPGGLYWDMPGVWREILAGLRGAGEWAVSSGVALRSVGVDAWGVDFALLDREGRVVEPPHCYRDEQHVAAHSRVLSVVPEAQLYALTGTRSMAINSLHQLRARMDAMPAASMARVSSLLFVPDYFHFLLSGVRVNEASIASTSEMVDRSTGTWAEGLLSMLGLPASMLGNIVPSGTVLGSLRSEIASQTGLEGRGEGELQVVVPAAHDTGSAVAAVPSLREESWGYVSSGTWSLMGVELDRPCLSETARRAAFTNEVGVGGTTRFHKNIVGLWVVQECRRDLERLGTKLDYAALTEAAALAEPFRTVLDSDHPPLLQPGDMLGKIRAFARSTGQPEPRTPGEFVRACLEALALSYRGTLGDLERVIARRMNVLRVVGGGGKNRLLNQMTADACERETVVGPLEATATGNVLVQAMGLGLVRDLTEVRRIVSRSTSAERFLPRDPGPWKDAAQRLHRITSGSAAGSRS